ncbi:MAG: sodium:proton antiporter, partial [Sedimenticolaceae bacterium]
MRNLATLLFLGGLVFLLLVLTASLPFGRPPMLVGDAIAQAAANEVGAANFVTAVVLGYRGLDTL